MPKGQVFFNATHVEVGRIQPLDIEVLMFTLKCGHTVTRQRSGYPHWQEGDSAMPVKRLACPFCGRAPERTI